MKLTFTRLKDSNGFALPTILLVSVVLLSILLSSVGAASSSRVALDSQYYNQLASQAVESGMARAKECLEGGGFTPQWATKALDRDLRPNTDCRGMTVLSNPYVQGYAYGTTPETHSRIRTHYSIEAPDGSGVGSALKVVGTAELVRASAPFAVWRRYEQVSYYRIEPPETEACFEGFVRVPGNAAFNTASGFCIAKYEAKSVGGLAVSVPAGAPHTGVPQALAAAAAQATCDGCHLVTENEWLTIMHDIMSVASNWSGGAVGSGYIYSGHNDNSPANSLAASTDDADGYFGTGDIVGNQRRTLKLSNGQVIWDFAGNVAEWTSGQLSGGQPGLSGYSWREWNTGGMTIGSLPFNPFPSFGTPAANSWTSSEGIGRLYSSSADNSPRAAVRGGYWNGGIDAGVASLSFNDAPTATSSTIGFRVAANPGGGTGNAIANNAPIQSITASQCASLPLFTGANSEAVRNVTDSRGGTTRIYQIARLADNKCWMLNNLRLGGSSSITLTPGDSDVTSNFTLPAIIMSGTSNSYDLPRTYGAVPGDSGSDATNYGYLYNWPAATAGASRTTNPAGSGSTLSSICPRGWRLPTGASSGSNFAQLDIAFGGTGNHAVGGPSIPRWQPGGAFQGVFSGYWNMSGGYTLTGLSGYLWSSSAHATDADRAHYTYTGDSASSQVNPGNDNYYRSVGMAVRCFMNI